MDRFYREALEVALKPSRWAGALLATLGGTSLAVVAFTPVAMALKLALAFVGAAFFLEAWARIVRAPASMLRFGRERAIQVKDARGRWRSGVVQDGAFVAPWLTIVRWRPEGARYDRTVLVLPDALDEEAFRALRVLLRWM